MDISTHAPLAGRDSEFLTPVEAVPISTHAPLAGRDLSVARMDGHPAYFNPRAPCGARLKDACARGRKCIISTHAPLAGRDFGKFDIPVGSLKFQPTRPLRGATKAY